MKFGKEILEFGVNHQKSSNINKLWQYLSLTGRASSEISLALLKSNTDVDTLLIYF